MTKDMPKDLLDELEAMYRSSRRQPGDVTSADLAERLGVSVKTAQRYLQQELQAKRLVRVRVIPEPPNNCVWVYRRPKEPTK